MFNPPQNKYVVPDDNQFTISKAASQPPAKSPGKKACRKRLQDLIEEMAELQKQFYANDNHALLLVFQAMDAAGKDGTIRAVMSGINPAGCQVFSFKQPSTEELDHDFLWRTSRCLPERGRIGIFNRSHYEEVLVVRVHPEYLANQRIEVPKKLDDLWESRYQSIRDQEKHLTANGTVILKFWLNVSRDEQRNRFLARIDNPKKNWKFSMSDVKERGHWEKYMDAYENMLNATSKPHAPWFAIPADNKDYMRMVVAETIVDTLKKLGPVYPKPPKGFSAELKKIRASLVKD